MKIVVIGATGNVGTSVVRALWAQPEREFQHTGCDHLRAHVADQRPGPIERRRSEVLAAPLHDVARAVAHAAADAFDRLVHELALDAIGLHACEVVLAGLLAPKLPFGPRPFVEERRHVRDEILHHGVAESFR